ncbi:GNAT family N-acetyltransferase [Solitalea sp. MAHUQ-68]|uniref:GNAT family N-acetyltransferase n=1 Tax=Solitalea agri TaxID=2953739 RepID=A0A9X2EYK9_9SPHI|nr:GNAT family N-acetyltransferase [Solitalea agri]MCO4291389.1 GNAT family N-acetyltransferase [Solitalea agri]
MQSESLTIRRVLPEEVDELVTISRQTFFESFSSMNTEEDMKNYLDEAYSSEKLSKELSDPNSEFYFAIFESQPVGYLKINFGNAQTELKEDNGLEIERIYVYADFQGKKIGQQLFNYAIETAKSHHLNYVWLGVWEKNQKAIQFYQKNGFKQFSTHIFVIGDDPQTDLMLKLEL